MPSQIDSTLPKDPAALLVVIAALQGELAEERAARRAAELGLQAKAIEAEGLRMQIARRHCHVVWGPSKFDREAEFA